MHVYTTAMVERILRNFVDIRCMLEARGQQLPDTYLIGPRREGTRHTRGPTDGKAKSRQIEELHVSTIDIVDGLARLSEDDRRLIVDYHIKQTKTLDDLVKEFKTQSRGSMQQRVYRSVARLTRTMNNDGGR
jgi:hypothetical protein